DRELMIRLPHLMIEGMIIAGFALQSETGYVYIRGEFVDSAIAVRKAIDQAYARGYLGKNILGVQGFNFDLHINMASVSYESCQAAGTMVGSGGYMVFNDKTDIVLLMRRTSEFYAHESCGKCTPCREGTRWMVKIYDRIVSGGGLPSDIDLLLNICAQIDGRSYCALGDAAAWPVVASIKHYRDEYEYWIEHGRSPIGDDCVPPVPKLTNPLLVLSPV